MIKSIILKLSKIDEVFFTKMHGIHNKIKIIMLPILFNQKSVFISDEDHAQLFTQ